MRHIRPEPCTSTTDRQPWHRPCRLTFLELYRSPRSPSPFPHTRPDRSWLAARPGSAPLNDLGWPALKAPGSTDVPEVSPPSLPSLSPSTRTTMPGRTSPFSGESTLRHTDRDRSATWCRVTYIVNTLYSIRLTANLRAQIDSGDPVLSFGYLTILLSSIVIEIIAILSENSPILRKIDLFDPLWPQIWPD